MAGSGGSGGAEHALVDAGTDPAGGRAGEGGQAGSGGQSESGSSGSGSDAGVPDPDLPGDGVASTRDLFGELLDKTNQEVEAKLTVAIERIFGIGTGEPNFPIKDSGYRLYYELPQDPSMAFIWAADSEDIRSEGVSYGMMIAVQRDMPAQFNRLWKFAQTFMQYPADHSIASWRHYFRWQGSVNTSNPSHWSVNYGATTGPAPDGEEYFAAALYLADARWGSNGSVNYRAQADALANAMLNNPSGDQGRTPIFRQDNHMVVFYPQGGSANFTDPSYHLPAFYELFASRGPSAHSARWLQSAEVSRQFLVTSAHGVTGLHPDYANFDGSPNTGGSDHDQFRYDAWRVVMNMAVDYAWYSEDERMRSQVEKYHAFFSTRLADGNVESSLFAIDGSNASGGGSTALTATLAAGALASDFAGKAEFVQNLWDVPQQSGTFRYYQELIYALGLLAASGRYAHDWSQ